MSNFMPIIFTQFFFIFNLNFSINYQKILNVPFTWCMYIIYIEAADQISYQKISEGFFWRVKRVINNSPTEKKNHNQISFFKAKCRVKELYNRKRFGGKKKAFNNYHNCSIFDIIFFLSMFLKIATRNSTHIFLKNDLIKFYMNFSVV